MKRTAAIAAALLFGTLVPAYALYTVSYTGDWPKTWPKELEPLRKQSRTMVGPMVEQRHFGIRFSKREEFEAAWPHILHVRTKAAPVFLVRGPSMFLGENAKAGVIIHCPPVGQSRNTRTPEGPIPGVTNPKVRWMNTNYIELVVDDEIIDAKSIALPKGTVVIDERDTGKERPAAPRT